MNYRRLNVEQKGLGVRVAKLEHEIQRMMDMQLEYFDRTDWKDKGRLGMSDCLMEEVILREELECLLQKN